MAILMCILAAECFDCAAYYNYYRQSGTFATF